MLPAITQPFYHQFSSNSLSTGTPFKIALRDIYISESVFSRESKSLHYGETADLTVSQQHLSNDTGIRVIC